MIGGRRVLEDERRVELQRLRRDYEEDFAEERVLPGEGARRGAALAREVADGEVIAVDDGRAAVVARVKGRDRAAALLRWAKALVSGVGAPVASVRNSR